MKITGFSEYADKYERIADPTLARRFEIVYRWQNGEQSQTLFEVYSQSTVVCQSRGTSGRDGIFHQ